MKTTEEEFDKSHFRNFRGEQLYLCISPYIHIKMLISQNLSKNRLIKFFFCDLHIFNKNIFQYIYV